MRIRYFRTNKKHFKNRRNSPLRKYFSSSQTTTNSNIGHVQQTHKVLKNIYCQPFPPPSKNKIFCHFIILVFVCVLNPVLTESIVKRRMFTK
mmetsp:Transcript_53597/g.62633  ORF Transcript_53597/g.62633 Transcript_53597/m.62633 type:complete len:92 (-) Transcript_53597:31-306(-)